MDLSDIRKLIRLMEKAELTELEIDDSNQGLRVHLKRSTAESVVHVVSPGGAGHAPMAAPSAAPAQHVEAGDAPLAPGTEYFTSPMVGTFYRAASPDSEAYAEVGTRLTDDSVLCIIEAMKVMNEIRSEVKGEVLEILLENGEPVEFGQPLFLIKKG
jgi:acetyl-CoA carboxylase biotin carboxyl carrier protein